VAAAGLIGRDEELAAIRALLAESRPGGLLLSGEPGIGKTVLWEAGVAEARAAGWTVLQHRSAQAEAGLAFAGLSDLLMNEFDRVSEGLLPPRRHALEVALLLVEPDAVAPDPRALGLALLDVMSHLATLAPVLLALDDVQWLDPSSSAVVSIAVRRLSDERVRVLATRRTQPGTPAIAEPFGDLFPRLEIGPLDLGAMHDLLRQALGHELLLSTLAAIDHASGGNPFFAVELARSASRDAGEPHIHVPDSLRDLLSGRIDRLPPATQQVLLDAAALVRPTVELVAPDEARLDALDVAVLERVVSVEDSGIRFAHPLLASLAYDRSPPGQRRATHARLAGLVGNPEERARHLALAAGDAYDETLARELDGAAGRAASRGATAAAAELTELAVRHTPSDDVLASRSRRLAAGRLHHQAGDVERAADIFDELLAELPPGVLRAEVLYASALTQRSSVRTRLAYLEQALALVGDDDALAAQVLGFTAINRWLGGQTAQGLADARAGLARAEKVGDPRLVATAIARVGWPEIWHLDATPGLLERGLRLERDLAPSRFQDSPRFTLACHKWMYDELDEARTMLEAFAASAEQRGDEVARGFSTMVLGSVEGLAGRLGRAVDLHDATLHLSQQIGDPQLELLARSFGSRSLLDAGRLDDARSWAMAANALALDVGDVTHGALAEGTLGQIDFVAGDLESACRRLEGLPERLLRQGSLHPFSAPWSEAIEALIGLGELDRAAELIGKLEDVAPRANRCARCIAGRARGLLRLAAGDCDGAVSAFEQALREESGIYPLERGRTLIALGGAHRHARRSRAARETLDAAVALLDEIGAGAWLDTAVAALGRISGRRASSGHGLTEGEQRVAQLAAQGRQNKEIAATLFISVGTVEMHLSRVYRKLGVRSRTELAGRFADVAQHAADV
jgi:DNA-binding CsgD family transcriptional regulator